MSFFQKIKTKILFILTPYGLNLFYYLILRYTKINIKVKNENLTFIFNYANYWFLHSYKEIFFDKVYFFQERSDSNDIRIIDCGANIGLSIIFYKKFYKNAKIIAFEPDINNLSLLRLNLEQNKILDVEVIDKAVWINNDGVYFEKNNGMGSKISTKESIGVNVGIVPSVKLSDYLNQKTDFLKIDIEGAELDILKDIKHCLNMINNIFIEYHCYKNEELKLDELLLIIKNAGFRYYIRQAYENISLPFIEKKGEFMDIQLNIFCFKQ